MPAAKPFWRVGLAKQRLTSTDPWLQIKSSHRPAYDAARDAFAALGVNAEQAMTALAAIPISVHCWQGDDVGGFEKKSGSAGGGIQATGNHPGRARTPDELRADLEAGLRDLQAL